MRNILHGPITLFLEEDNGGNATSGTGALSSVTTEGSQPDGEKTFGEGEGDVEYVKPDFGALFGDKTKEEKPEPKPEPKAAEKAPEAKPEPETKPEAKPEPKAETKPAPQPPKAEAKPEPKAEAKPTVPDTDDDLDKMQVRATNPKLAADFKNLREMTKAARTEARTYKSELETLRSEVEQLKAQPKAQVPEEITKELEELRAQKEQLSHKVRVYLGEEDVELAKELDKGIEDAKTSIYDFVTKHGIPEHVLEEIKGYKNPLDWPGWTKAYEDLQKNAGILEARKLEKVLEGHDVAVKSRADKLQQLAADREAYGKEAESIRVARWNEFGEAIQKASLPMARKYNDTIMLKDIPANATPEQKAKLEAENAQRLKNRDYFAQAVADTYNRNPERVAEIAFKAMRADMLEARTKEAELELAAKSARVEELEAELAAIRSAGRLAHESGSAASQETPQRRTTEAPESVGGDGREAMRNFFANR